MDGFACPPSSARAAAANAYSGEAPSTVNGFHDMDREWGLNRTQPLSSLLTSSAVLAAPILRISRAR
jgi:hypothetical protein